jgi:hypothetical protein
MGNALEALQREGTAVREWSLGLSALLRENLGAHPTAALLRMAIEAHCESPRVFLSYSASEAELASELNAYLHVNRIECIEYQENFTAGNAINDEIVRALDIASVVVVLWSSRYVTRPYCVAEIESALLRIREWRAYGLAPLLLILRTDSKEVPELGGDIFIDARDGLTESVQRQILNAIRRRSIGDTKTISVTDRKE